MANRPSDFDTTTPTGASSPRQGDDELRKIKTYTQNAYNDLTQASGVGVTHTNLYGTIVTADTHFDGDIRGDVQNAEGTVIVDVSEARFMGNADGVEGVTATVAELNVLDGVTATTAEINKLDTAVGEYLGIIKVESDAENDDPTVADFENNVTIIGQY